jgi:hypothetical protein
MLTLSVFVDFHLVFGCTFFGPHELLELKGVLMNGLHAGCEEVPTNGGPR